MSLWSGDVYPVINDWLYPLINTDFRVYFLDIRWYIIKIAHWLIKPSKQIPNGLRSNFNTWVHEGTGLEKGTLLYSTELSLSRNEGPYVR